MARYFSAAGRHELTLDAAVARGLTWDVFVSHTTNDDALAEVVAKCIRSCGLTAWVDSDDSGSQARRTWNGIEDPGSDPAFILLVGCRDECDKRVVVGVV